MFMTSTVKLKAITRGGHSKPILSNRGRKEKEKGKRREERNKEGRNKIGLVVAGSIATKRKTGFGE